MGGRDLARQISECNGEEEINVLFTELKPSFSELLEDGEGCKILSAFIGKIARFSIGTQRKMARIVKSWFPSLLGGKDGCAVLKTCLASFKNEAKLIVAESLVDLDSDQLSKFWVYGISAFRLGLDCLDEKAVGIVCGNLSGHMTKMSCCVKQYPGVQEILKRVRDSSIFDDIIEEMQADFPTLAVDRFGAKVMKTLIEIAPQEIVDKIGKSLMGSLKDLAVHQCGHHVLISLLKYASSDVQDLFVEEFCQEKSSDANTAVVDLSHHPAGHNVVIALLEGSRGRSSLQELKTALLFKQEFLYANEFASKVLKMTRLV